MELRVLKYFLTVAREENITKAANLLHITQPTLSRQLMQLEEELGIKLFQRGRHNIMLTEEGMLLRRRAQEIVDLTEKTEKELVHGAETVSGEISIGCGETQNMKPLCEMIAAFQEKYPEVVFHIYTAIADDVTERLENGVLDMGLLLEPVEISRYHFVRMPLEEKWQVLMRKDCPLAEKETICAEDLWDKPLIVSHQTSINTEMFRWLKADISRLNIVATYDLIYNAAQFVRKGFGYVIALDRLINTTGDSNLSFRPLFPTLEAELCIVWKKYQVLSRASSAFLQQLKAET